MITFDDAVEFTLKEEIGGSVNGGYVNDPDDPGGETKWGVSKRAHPNLDIANLTWEDALKLWKLDYWDHYKVERIPGILRVYYFDALYHHRPSTAAKILQRGVGAVPDGRIGPNTIHACSLYVIDGDYVDVCAERQVLMIKIVNRRYVKRRRTHPRSPLRIRSNTLRSTPEDGHGAF